MSPTNAIQQIATDAGLSLEHPPEVEAEARALAASPGIDDPTLVDLTHLPLVTIDEESSKDLDQALFVEPREGGWRVWYAIADAAWFVRPGTALFAEAVRRGSSFYLPGLVIPLLPRVLSEDIVSLNPGVDRRALMFRVDLHEDGRVERTKIVRARVHCVVKTWYDAVQEWFDGRRLCPGGPEVAASLRCLREVGRRRMELAESRDVVQFRRQELRVHLNEEDAGFVATVDLRNDVERWNEQISLLCNVEGARLFENPPEHVQAIFRTHEPPATEGLDQLQTTLGALIKVHELDPEHWAWKRGSESLASWLDRLPEGTGKGRIGRALHRQALLSTGRAAFSGMPGRHYGVGAELYARFTAPMREVVGIFTHKECWEQLGVEAAEENAADEALREAVIAVAHQSRQTQRKLDQEANRLVLDALFEADLALPLKERPRRRGTVMGISRGKVHVQLDDPPIDVKVYRFHLMRQRGVELFDGNDGATLRDRRTGDAIVSVGQGVDLWVIGKDGERDRWELGL